MTAQRWMELWETALHGALEACEGVPTIIFDPKQIMEDVPKATQRLMDLLTGVGALPKLSAENRHLIHAPSSVRGLYQRKWVARNSCTVHKPVHMHQHTASILAAKLAAVVVSQRDTFGCKLQGSRA